MATLNIVYACSDLYSKIAAVSIISLLGNNKNAEHIRIFVLGDHITPENRNRLKKTVTDYNREFVYIDITPKLELIAPYVSIYNSSLTIYSKFFISDVIHDDRIQKILFLGSDTIVNGSIEDLFEMEMENKPIAMAVDCIRNEYKTHIGSPLNKPYFSTDVSLIDLKKWRELDCTKMIFDHMKNVRSHYPLGDQDIITCALGDHVSKLDMKYCFLSQCFLFDYKGALSVYKLKKEYYYSKDQYENAKKKPIIYHLCGQTFGRIWFKNSKHPLKAKWDTYYFASEWRNVPQDNSRMTLPYRLQYFLYKIMPIRLSSLINMLMQRVFIYLSYKV